MEAIEIRYAGIVVGRASEARDADDGIGTVLLVPEPMPVGTVVSVGAEATPMRVTKVTESADAAVAGMVVHPLDARVRRPAPVVMERAPEVAAAIEEPPLQVVEAVVEPTPAPVMLSQIAPPAPGSVPSAAFAETAPTVADSDPSAPDETPPPAQVVEGRRRARRRRR